MMSELNQFQHPIFQDCAGRDLEHVSQPQPSRARLFPVRLGARARMIASRRLAIDILVGQERRLRENNPGFTIQPGSQWPKSKQGFRTLDAQCDFEVPTLATFRIRRFQDCRATAPGHDVHIRALRTQR